VIVYPALAVTVPREGMVGDILESVNVRVFVKVKEFDTKDVTESIVFYIYEGLV
jgi:hypothetical protein